MDQHLETLHFTMGITMGFLLSLVFVFYLSSPGTSAPLDVSEVQGDGLQGILKELQRLHQEAREVDDATGVQGCPCEYGSCRASMREDPFGWGFYCICEQGVGGHLCQIADACSQHPCGDGYKCVPSSMNDRAGRLCFKRFGNMYRT